MVYKFLDKKSVSVTDISAKSGSVNTEIKQNEQLAEELHKLKEFKKEEFILHLKTIFEMLI